MLTAEDVYLTSSSTRPAGVIERDGQLHQCGSQGLSQAGAVEAASGMGFRLGGVTHQGRLATVTSAGKETFLENALLSRNGGAYYASGPAAFRLGGANIGGQWQWTSEPETRRFLSYSDWGYFEAGQRNEPELVLNMFERSDINGKWYSYEADDAAYVRGYVVEFDPLA